jgi:hypothetical protein
MKSRSPGIVWAATICLGWLTGCLSSDRAPYSRDPLLASRRAVRSTEGREPPALLTFAEPKQPALPPAAYAALPPAYRIGTDLPPLPAPPKIYADSNSNQGLAQKAVVATLAPRVKTSAAVPALAVSRQKTPAYCRHAGNFSWIEGVLDRSAAGQWHLRYGAPGVGDPWDGQVALGNDPRLEQLQPGDHIKVEGEISANRIESELPPLYRIFTLQLVR